MHLLSPKIHVSYNFPFTICKPQACFGLQAMQYASVKGVLNLFSGGNSPMFGQKEGNVAFH